MAIIYNNKRITKVILLLERPAENGASFITKCFIAEWMHKNQDKKFTYSTLKGIIQKVKEVYPELPWRS